LKKLRTEYVGGGLYITELQKEATMTSENTHLRCVVISSGHTESSWAAPASDRSVVRDTRSFLRRLLHPLLMREKMLVRQAQFLAELPEVSTDGDISSCSFCKTTNRVVPENRPLYKKLINKSMSELGFEKESLCKDSKS